jgi:hypothetical protein
VSTVNVRCDSSAPLATSQTAGVVGGVPLLFWIFITVHLCRDLLGDRAGALLRLRLMLSDVIDAQRPPRRGAAPSPPRCRGCPFPRAHVAMLPCCVRHRVCVCEPDRRALQCGGASTASASASS